MAAQAESRTDPFAAIGVDVESIHPRARALLSHRIGTAAGATTRGHGVLVLGESGAGKSHLLSWLQHREAPNIAVALLRPPIAADRTYRHLLREAITRFSFAVPGSASPLERIARSLLGRLASETTLRAGLRTAPIAASLRELQSGTISAEALSANLDELRQCTLDRTVKIDPEIDTGFAEVFTKLLDGDPTVRDLARRYIRGDSLESADRTTLGVRTSDPSCRGEREEDARRAFRQFCKVCRVAKTTLVVAIDDLVASEACPALVDALRNLLRYEAGLVVVVTADCEEWEAITLDDANASSVFDATIRLRPLVESEMDDLISGYLATADSRGGDAFDGDAPAAILAAWSAEEECYPRQALERAAATLVGADVAPPSAARSQPADEPDAEVTVPDELRRAAEQFNRSNRDQRTAHIRPPLLPSERDADALSFSLDPVGFYFSLFEEMVAHLSDDPAAAPEHCATETLAAAARDLVAALANRGARISGAAIGAVEVERTHLVVELRRGDRSIRHEIVLGIDSVPAPGTTVSLTADQALQLLAAARLRRQKPRVDRRILSAAELDRLLVQSQMLDDHPLLLELRRIALLPSTEATATGGASG